MTFISYLLWLLCSHIYTYISSVTMASWATNVSLTFIYTTEGNKILKLLIRTLADNI